jgi:queuine/archaeosine tRNA-ribosyltransferase
MADSAKSQARGCNPAGLCARRVRFRLSKRGLTTECICDVCTVLFRHAVMAHLSRAEDPERGGRLKTAESLRDAP